MLDTHVQIFLNEMWYLSWGIS